MALVIAVGVNDTGERVLLGFDLGASEEEAFWTAFLHGLVSRGLKGARLVISDAYQGLKAAVAGIFAGARGAAGCISCAMSWPTSRRATRP